MNTLRTEARERLRVKHTSSIRDMFSLSLHFRTAHRRAKYHVVRSSNRFVRSAICDCSSCSALSVGSRALLIATSRALVCESLAAPEAARTLSSLFSIGLRATPIARWTGSLGFDDSPLSEDIWLAVPVRSNFIRCITSARFVSILLSKSSESVLCVFESTSSAGRISLIVVALGAASLVASSVAASSHLPSFCENFSFTCARDQT
mmetsp:Transcript_21865/g.53726  ORF Transcript_21865/g.53726 Transcript_21865/m.53726 type:complete len:206 (-) Transcript_21865:190-807(-)